MKKTFSRRGAVSIFMLILLVIGLLVLVFVIWPLLKQMWGAIKSGYACEGECLADCGEGYMRQYRGDTYCAEQFAGTKTGATKCCEPIAITPGGVRGGDIRIYHRAIAGTPLANGARFDLQLTKEFAVQDSLNVQLKGDVPEKKCYWEVHKPNGDWGYATSKANLLRLSKATATPTQTVACKDLTGQYTLSLDKGAYWANTGGTYTLTLNVLNDGSIVAAHTVYAVLPDRNPVVRLTINDQAASSSSVNKLSPGETYNLKVSITEPYEQCTIESTGSHPEAPQGLDKPEDCAVDEWTKTFTLPVSDNALGGLGFTLAVKTGASDALTNIVGSVKEDQRLLVETYDFAVTQDKTKLQVQGPAPGLTREKHVDVVCGQPCEKLALYTVSTPQECGVTNNMEETTVVPTTYGEVGGATTRFTVEEESVSGEYACVKATLPNEQSTTNQNSEYYALGLWNDLPSPFNVDSTPPNLELDWHSFEGYLELSCNDPENSAGGEKSGCKERPFSFAYVTDPLLFVTNIVTGGTLAGEWHGCPDPETGDWILYNSDKPEFTYPSHDIRVICVRATDNAGNHAVKSRLLYSSQELLALLLKEYAPKVNKALS